MPVDDPPTHLELTMVHEVMILDHSGPELAAMQYASALKMTIYAGLIAALLNPVRSASTAPAACALVALVVMGGGRGGGGLRRVAGRPAAHAPGAALPDAGLAGRRPSCLGAAGWLARAAHDAAADPLPGRGGDPGLLRQDPLGAVLAGRAGAGAGLDIGVAHHGELVGPRAGGAGRGAGACARPIAPLLLRRAIRRRAEPQSRPDAVQPVRLGDRDRADRAGLRIRRAAR